MSKRFCEGCTSYQIGCPTLDKFFSDRRTVARVAEFLFKNGAKVDYVARDGETIIHIAILSGNPDIVALALQYDAPLGFTDPKGQSTWDLARDSGNSKIKKLIRKALKKLKATNLKS